LPRARWSPHHRGTLRTLVAPGLALSLVLLAGPVADATPTPSSLHQRLTRINAQADQAVERYLQAKLALQQTQRSAAGLQRRAADARQELDRLSAAISAQAADTYVNGAGAGLASVLGAGDPNVAFDRMQTLSVLAQQNSDRLADLRAAEQVYQQGLATLTNVQRQQAAQLRRLATRKTQVQQLVDQTERLLAQLRASAASRRYAAAGGGDVDPGLPAGSAPAPSGSVVAVVRYAEAQVGKPYVWGADGPSSFDCSGLTMMAWRQAGISLPHSATAQYSVGRHVTRAELQPGDLIFRYSPISHVAMYVGNGMQVAATHTGSTVKLQSAFQDEIVGYSRPTG
jgi:peptidoglycan DL-endopeptidase CwlO